MGNTDADARSELARRAAKAMWERRGNPVVTRSAEVVITRAGELDESTRADIVAAVTRAGGPDDD